LLQEAEVDEKILTQHPEPAKQGVRINKVKYDVIRETILDILQVRDEMTFTEMAQAVSQRLEGRFEGSVPWYVVTVKLDLEARQIIERVPKTRPERLRLVAGYR
jgi:hypothetical protein